MVVAMQWLSVWFKSDSHGSNRIGRDRGHGNGIWWITIIVACSVIQERLDLSGQMINKKKGKNKNIAKLQNDANCQIMRLKGA